MIKLELTPDEATALYQASCGYKPRLPAQKPALLAALRKLIDASFEAGFSVLPDLTVEP